MNPWTSRCTALLLAGMLGACANYGIPMHEIAPKINNTLYAGPYLIQPGDFLTISFPIAPRYDTQAQVRLDGSINLPVVGEFKVAGMDPTALSAALVEAYNVAPEQPDDVVVNVGLALPGGAGANSGLTVTGELNSPGLITLSGNRITLLEAIGRAGGHLTPTALLGNTLLVRRSPVTGLQQSWRIDARHRHWGKGDPIFLQPMDLVFVPNTPVDDVNNFINEYINQNIPAAGVLGLVLGIALAD